MQKLILTTSLSPGDVVMLTAAVRDLHLNYPGQFLTDVRTDYPDLWFNNPYITSLSEEHADVLKIECHYPLVHTSNTLPYHCIQGYSDFLAATLGLQIRPTAFRGDIYLSEAEKMFPSILDGLLAEDTPYWIVVAGGKFDFTIKWWDSRRYQTVVNHFAGKINFVQIGLLEHHHPLLAGVIDLRGNTSLRDVVRLVYHAQGVLCPVTAIMHLVAAVETQDRTKPLRPCVVIAGGREPVHWEAYPGHQFLHTIGALSCCASGGCWQSRTSQLGDGDKMDSPYRLCHDVVDGLPHCMDMITSEEVIRRIELYFQSGQVSYA